MSMGSFLSAVEVLRLQHEQNDTFSRGNASPPAEIPTAQQNTAGVMSLMGAFNNTRKK